MIPERVLKWLGLEKEQLHKIDIFISAFRNFREEKRIIKSIKFKAENIKIYTKYELQSFDSVCKALVLDGHDRERKQLKYNLIK